MDTCSILGVTIAFPVCAAHLTIQVKEEHRKQEMHAWQPIICSETWAVLVTVFWTSHLPEGILRINFWDSKIFQLTWDLSLGK